MKLRTQKNTHNAQKGASLLEVISVTLITVLLFGGAFVAMAQLKSISDSSAEVVADDQAYAQLFAEVTKLLSKVSNLVYFKHSDQKKEWRFKFRGEDGITYGALVLDGTELAQYTCVGIGNEQFTKKDEYVNCTTGKKVLAPNIPDFDIKLDKITATVDLTDGQLLDDQQSLRIVLTRLRGSVGQPIGVEKDKLIGEFVLQLIPDEDDTVYMRNVGSLPPGTNQPGGCNDPTICNKQPDIEIPLNPPVSNPPVSNPTDPSDGVNPPGTNPTDPSENTLNVSVSEQEMPYYYWYALVQAVKNKKNILGNPLYGYEVAPGNEGSDGSTGSKPGAANSDTPVTGLSLGEVIVGLNALSQYQLLNPVYYDKNGIVKNADNIDWGTLIATRNNGYRLPRVAEWQVMAKFIGMTTLASLNERWTVSNNWNRPAGWRWTIPSTSTGEAKVDGDKLVLSTNEAGASQWWTDVPVRPNTPYVLKASLSCNTCSAHISVFVRRNGILEPYRASQHDQGTQDVTMRVMIPADVDAVRIHAHKDDGGKMEVQNVSWTQEVDISRDIPEKQMEIKSQNLLQNGDAENGINSWNKEIFFGNTMTTTTTTQLADDQKKLWVIEGLHSFVISTKSQKAQQGVYFHKGMAGTAKQETGRLYQDVDVEPGKMYRLSGWLSCHRCEAYLHVQGLDGDENESFAKSSNIVSNTMNETLRSIVFVASPQTQKVRVSIMKGKSVPDLYSTVYDDYVYADALKLEKIQLPGVKHNFIEINNLSETIMYSVCAQCASGAVDDTEDSTKMVAWYNGNANGKTQFSKTKEKNPLGFYDVSGNVAEWLFAPDPSGYRVYGGSANSPRNNVTVNSYETKPQMDKNLFTGFRTVRTEVPKDIVQLIYAVQQPRAGATAITKFETEQYTADVVWSQALDGGSVFKADTEYTATITITAKNGYSVNSVGENHFTVVGAKSTTNSAGSGTINAVFRKTDKTISGTQIDFGPSIDPVLQVGQAMSYREGYTLPVKHDGDGKIQYNAVIAQWEKKVGENWVATTITKVESNTQYRVNIHVVPETGAVMQRRFDGYRPNTTDAQGYTLYGIAENAFRLKGVPETRYTVNHPAGNVEQPLHVMFTFNPTPQTITSTDISHSLLPYPHPGEVAKEEFDTDQYTANVRWLSDEGLREKDDLYNGDGTKKNYADRPVGWHPGRADDNRSNTKLFVNSNGVMQLEDPERNSFMFTDVTAKPNTNYVLTGDIACDLCEAQVHVHYVQNGQTKRVDYNLPENATRSVLKPFRIVVPVPDGVTRIRIFMVKVSSNEKLLVDNVQWRQDGIPIEAHMEYGGNLLENPGAEDNEGSSPVSARPMDMVQVGETGVTYSVPIASDQNYENVFGKTCDHTNMNNCIDTYKNVEGGFWIGETEVDYSTWYNVRTWAEKNGYKFYFAGREGLDIKTQWVDSGNGNGYNAQIPQTNDTIGIEPSQNGRSTPVGSIGWLDAIVWSNALSEKEGLTPVYRDSGDNVLKDSSDATKIAGMKVLNNVHGYRLPKSDELEMAARWIGKTAPSTGSLKNDALHSFANGVKHYWTPKNYASGATEPATNSDETSKFKKSCQCLHTSKSTDPNQLGMFEVNANALELTSDMSTYGRQNYYMQPSDSNRYALGSIRYRLAPSSTKFAIENKDSYSNYANSYYLYDGLRIAANFSTNSNPTPAIGIKNWKTWEGATSNSVTFTHTKTLTQDVSLWTIDGERSFVISSNNAVFQVGSDADHGAYYQDVSVKPNTTYRLRGMMNCHRCIGYLKAELFSHVSDDAQSMGVRASVGTTNHEMDRDGTEKNYSVFFKTPANAVRVRIHLYKGDSHRDEFSDKHHDYFFADDIALQEVTKIPYHAMNDARFAISNLSTGVQEREAIYNGNGDLINYANRPLGWHPGNGSGNKSGTRLQVTNGVMELKDTRDDSFVFTDVAAKPNKEYVLSGVSACDACDARIDVDFIKNNGVTKVQYELDDQANLTPFSKNITVPADVTRVRIFFVKKGDGGTLKLDNVSWRQVGQKIDERIALDNTNVLKNANAEDIDNNGRPKHWQQWKPGSGYGECFTTDKLSVDRPLWVMEGQRSINIETVSAVNNDQSVHVACYQDVAVYPNTTYRLRGMLNCHRCIGYLEAELFSHESDDTSKIGGRASVSTTNHLLEFDGTEKNYSIVFKTPSNAKRARIHIVKRDSKPDAHNSNGVLRDYLFADNIQLQLVTDLPLSAIDPDGLGGQKKFAPDTVYVPMVNIVAKEGYTLSNSGPFTWDGDAFQVGPSHTQFYPDGLFADDISLKKWGDQTELVKNGNAENGIANWTTRTKTGATAIHATNRDFWTISDTASLMITTPSQIKEGGEQHHGDFYQDIDVAPNQTYVLKGKINCHRCEGALYVEERTATGVLLRSGAAVQDFPWEIVRHHWRNNNPTDFKSFLDNDKAVRTIDRMFVTSPSTHKLRIVIYKGNSANYFAEGLLVGKKQTVDKNIFVPIAKRGATASEDVIDTKAGMEVTQKWEVKNGTAWSAHTGAFAVGQTYRVLLAPKRVGSTNTTTKERTLFGLASDYFTAKDADQPPCDTCITSTVYDSVNKLITVQFKAIVPPKVEGVSASWKTHNTHVQINWEKNLSVSSYHVYRDGIKTPPQYNLCLSDPCVYYDTNATPGQKHEYYVLSVVNSVEGDASEADKVYGMRQGVPQKPTRAWVSFVQVPSATNGGWHITSLGGIVQWEHEWNEDKTTSYKVYRQKWAERCGGYDLGSYDTMSMYLNFSPGKRSASYNMDNCLPTWVHTNTVNDKTKNYIYESIGLDQLVWRFKIEACSQVGCSAPTYTPWYAYTWRGHSDYNHVVGGNWTWLEQIADEDSNITDTKAYGFPHGWSTFAARGTLSHPNHGYYFNAFAKHTTSGGESFLYWWLPE